MSVWDYLNPLAPVQHLWDSAASGLSSAVNAGTNWVVNGVDHGTHALADKIGGSTAHAIADGITGTVGVAGGALQGASAMVGSVEHVLAHPLDTMATSATMASHIPGISHVVGAVDNVAHGRRIGAGLNHLVPERDAEYWSNFGHHAVKPYADLADPDAGAGRHGIAGGRLAFDLVSTLLSPGEGGGGAEAAQAAHGGEAARAAHGAEAAEAARGAEAAQAAHTVPGPSGGSRAGGTFLPGRRDVAVSPGPTPIPTPPALRPTTGITTPPALRPTIVPPPRLDVDRMMGGPGRAPINVPRPITPHGPAVAHAPHAHSSVMAGIHALQHASHPAHVIHAAPGGHEDHERRPLHGPAGH